MVATRNRRERVLETLRRLVDLPGPSILGHLACGAIVRRDAFLSAAEREPWGPRWARYRRNDTLICWMRRPLRVAVRQTARLVGDAVREPAARPALAQMIRLLPRALRERRAAPRPIERALRAVHAADR